MSFNITSILINETNADNDLLYEQKEIQTLKLTAIFTLLFFSLLGVSIPLYFASKFDPVVLKNHYAFSIFQSFSAGIIISVAFIHLLSDASSTLQASYPEYPALSFAVAIAGIFFVFSLEQTMLSIFLSPIKVNDEGLPKFIDESGQQHAEHDEKQHQHETVLQETINNLIDSKSVRIILKTYLMQMSIAFHSVIIGVDFGTMNSIEELPEMKALMVALIFHQFFEGTSLGLMLSSVRDKLGLIKITVFSLFFAMQVSMGIIIGMIIANDFKTGTDYDELSQTYTTSCMNSFAAGILIYIGLVEMLSEAFSNKEVKSNPLIKAVMILALASGLLCMAIIAIWA
jgi:zinc transporter 1/2/3